MTSLHLTGIASLVTCDPESGAGLLGVVQDAAIVIEGDALIYAGTAAAAPTGADQKVDVGGRCVIPGFVDAHTHLVFGGDRASEFVRRMSGQAYSPKGILATVAATRTTPPEELERRARRLAIEAGAQGTTTLEVKTGYGLTPEHEAMLLSVARGLTQEVTFLGAHLVPPEYESDRDSYIQLLTDVMIPASAGAARWCDVFCEAGAFSPDESRTVLQAGTRAGMGLRVHANQLGPGAGVRLACELGAASADHCTYLERSDVDDLAMSGTVATLLPLSDFCTRQPYADGRALLDAGAAVALASNCNPGSSFSTSMALAMALAVRYCGLTVDEALSAATAGGARALRRSDVGRLVKGARADLVILDAPAHEHLVYRLGANLVWRVLQGGHWAVDAAAPSQV